MQTEAPSRERMALYIRDTSVVPREGWRYPGLNGHNVVVRNYSILYSEIVKHYTANGQEPPSQGEVTKYLCEHLAVPCFDGNQPLINRFTLGIPAQAKGCCGS